MTIHLPEPLESSILAAVHSGQFESVDDAMAEAARLLLRQIKQGQEAVSPQPATTQEPPANAFKPIWEEIQEITAGIPDEEFLKLPVDGAEQHDHCIYGTPKRPPSQLDEYLLMQSIGSPQPTAKTNGMLKSSP